MSDLRDKCGGTATVRVWRADLDRPDAEIAALRASLSDDERERADRFRFERDRRRFTAARGLLRTLLGREIGVDPGSIAFSYGRMGKPALLRPGVGGLEFNVSHSQGLALFAVARGRVVGVDLEFRRPGFDIHGIADRFFTARESARIASLPPEDRPPAFFRGWTRKEAFLKARGDGLWLGLDQFEVSLDPDAPARLVHTAWDPDEARRWSLHDLDVADGFAAALAVAGDVPGPIPVESFPTGA